MLDSLLFSLNSVAPIFLLTLLGALLGHKKFLNDGFLAAADKLVFKICLPCLLFVDIATADIGEYMNMRLLMFCIVAVILSFLIPCLLVPIFLKENAKRGAFIQGVYRANTAIIGIDAHTPDRMDNLEMHRTCIDLAEKFGLKLVDYLPGLGIL